MQMRHTMHAAQFSPCLLQTARARPAPALAAAALRRPAARQRLPLAPVAAGYQQPLTNQQRKAKRAEAQRLGRSICTVRHINRWFPCVACLPLALPALPSPSAL